MASVASRPRLIPRPGLVPSGVAAAGALVLAALAASVVLKSLALGASFWMDEGLSVGIATQPFLDIPGTLRQDGSPPLYYLLLHVWMNVVGDSEGRTQGLSVLIALLAVPGGLWAGWSLFGRRAGLICAGLAAVNPFLTQYAQETRMYSLMVLLSLLGTAAFLHAFVYRRHAFAYVFAVLLALLLYTHNWGLFFTIGCLGAMGVVLYESEERRALLREALLGFGGAALLYAPWLPTLGYQAVHTGAPWVNPPRFGAPVQITKSLLGGGSATVAIVLGIGAGLGGIMGRRPRSRDRTAVLVLIALPVVTLGIAWLVSQVSPAWTTRYLGVALGPIFLLTALGLARAGRLGLVALLIVLAVWAVPRTYDVKNKSNAKELSTAVEPRLKRGDLVISTQPEQTPLINYRLPDGLDYATILGPVDNPNVMDWRDAVERMEDARVETSLEPLLAKLPRSSHVLLVRPVTTSVNDWDAPWTRLVRRRSAQWGQALDRDTRFRRTAALPRFYHRATRIGIRGVLYEKIRD
jgi:mannosyltransferase